MIEITNEGGAEGERKTGCPAEQEPDTGLHQGPWDHDLSGHLTNCTTRVPQKSRKF